MILLAIAIVWVIVPAVVLLAAVALAARADRRADEITRERDLARLALDRDARGDDAEYELESEWSHR